MSNNRGRSVLAADRERQDAARGLLARSGCEDVNFMYLGDKREWSIGGVWAGGGTLTIDGARTSTDALEALAALATENALCNGCARLVWLVGYTDHLALGQTERRCPWKRHGAVWVAGCDPEPPAA